MFHSFYYSLGPGRIGVFLIHECMTTSSTLVRLVKILLFKKEAMKQVADDSSLNPLASLFFALSIVLFSIALQISYQTVSFSPEYTSLLSFDQIQWSLTFVLSLVFMVSFLLTIYLIHLMVKYLFQGKANFLSFFRVLSFAGVITWFFSLAFFVGFIPGAFEGYLVFLAIFPILSIVAFIWSIPLCFRVIRVTYQLSGLSTLAVFLLGFVIMLNVNRTFVWFIDFL